jgi:thiosulfate/3-mercaptopyruvate sulfurtransferase
MQESTLISVDALRALLHDEHVVLLDCGFDLVDTKAGERAYTQGHLPGAYRADLDRDLSSAKTGRNGRHPLPTRETFARTVAAWGVAPGVAVVCYDDQGGVYAARAWWMLRWLGHASVAVLDGGKGAWLAAGGTLDTALPALHRAAPYPIGTASMPTVQADQLLEQTSRTIVDARSAERFRGEVEPLDPVAGRIPGARNRFHKDNLGPDGRFKPAAELRAAFESLQRDATRVVHQCGSGVTACHNLLAMEHAGLTGSALYPGSWSEWCADPSRPIAKG